MKRTNTPVENNEEINPVGDAIDKAEQRAAAREEKKAALEDADIQKIDSIVLSDDLQKGGKIRIERRGPLDQKWGYLATIPAEEWDTIDRIEWVKNMFGGGDYQCRTFRASGQMYKMFNFSIDPRFKGKLDESEIAKFNSESPTKNGTAESNNLMLKMLDMARAPQPNQGINMTDMMALMDKSSGRSEQANMMMMTMMMKSMETAQQNMATMMTTLVTVMASNKPTDNTSLLLELIKHKQEKTPLNETLDMMAKVKEIFEKPEAEDKDDMFSKIGRIAGPVLGHFMGGKLPQMQQQQAEVSAPQPETQPGQIPQGQQPPAIGGIVGSLPASQRFLFDMMLAAAAKNSDPGVYADLITDQTDPQSLEGFKGILTAPDWCAKLFGNEASVASIRPWLEELRSLLLDNGADSNIPAATGAVHPDSAGPSIT